MKTRLTFAAVLIALAAGAETAKANAFATPDESSVVQGAASRKVHIPPGTWKGDDGKVYEGPSSIEVATPLARLPHFEKVSK